MGSMEVKKTLFEIISTESGYSWPCGPGADSDPDPINEFYVKLGVKRIEGDTSDVTLLDVGHFESHILLHNLDTKWEGWGCYFQKVGDRILLTYEDFVTGTLKESWQRGILHDRDILAVEEYRIAKR